MADPRGELATALREGLSLAGVEANVYAFPPEGPVAPAVAIAPGTPYRGDLAYDRERWGFDLLVLVARQTNPDAAYTALDTLVSGVRSVVRGLSGATWGGVSLVGQTPPVGGVEYLSATCPVAMTTEG